MDSTIHHLTSTCNCTGKTCTRCNTPQCLEGFHRFKHSPDGRRSDCKICRKAERETETFKAKRRGHDREHVEQINEQKREWYHSNPERPRGYVRNYRKKNPEKVKSYSGEYNKSERGKQRHQAYRDRNPEKVRQFGKEWKENHPEMVQEHAKVRAANYKAKRLGILGKITVLQWRELKAHFDNTCLRCGQQEPAIDLTLDHVIPFAHLGPNEITNIQPLCRFCNTSKGIKIIDYRIAYEEKKCG